MNQQLAVRNELQASNPIADLPNWLQYLIGAYPTSKTTPGQLLVMEDQFSDLDGGSLMQAAREFVKSDKRAYKGFPTAPDFRPVVEKIQSNQETPVIDVTVKRIELRLRRRGLLELWHIDRASDHDLLVLADDMQHAGMIHAAMSLREKVSVVDISVKR